MEGQLPNGQLARTHHVITHPEGQAPLSALSVALTVERLLGLSGNDAPVPGLYLPKLLLDPPTYVVETLLVMTCRAARRCPMPIKAKTSRAITGR